MKQIQKVSCVSLWLFSIVIILGSCKAQKMRSDKLIPQDYVITQLGDKELSDAKLTLNVNPENSTISGQSGCNNYSFNYKLEGEQLDLGFASATKMYCEEAMDMENLFFQKAASVTHFENSKQKIIFKNKEGETVITAKNRKDSE